jgi:3'(2'), 5'-bisphosphate nucleotidase
MNDASLLALADDLARRAGEAILAVRARGFETFAKADLSPVTEADHAAEAIIVAGLRAAMPGIPVIAEEEVASGHVAEPGPAFWLVDPLDGTREFAAGSDEFTVNIGLIRDGRPVLGLVFVPAMGEVFGGIAGQGAWKRSAAGQVPIRVRTPPPEGLTIMASRHHAKGPEMEKFLAGRSVAEITNIGSSLKFCRVAEGKVDLYPRFGRTMEWDTAAAHAVVEAAGGKVFGMDDSPLRYGKPGFENPFFICTGG